MGQSLREAAGCWLSAKMLTDDSAPEMMKMMEMIMARIEMEDEGVCPVGAVWGTPLGAGEHDAGRNLGKYDAGWNNVADGAMDHCGSEKIGALGEIVAAAVVASGD